MPKSKIIWTDCKIRLPPDTIEFIILRDKKYGLLALDVGWSLNEWLKPEYLYEWTSYTLEKLSSLR